MTWENKYDELIKEQNKLVDIYNAIGSGDDLSNDQLEMIHKTIDDRLNDINGELDYLERVADYGTGVLNDDGTMMTYEELEAYANEQIKADNPVDTIVNSIEYAAKRYGV